MTIAWRRLLALQGLVVIAVAAPALARPVVPGEACPHLEVVTFPTGGPERTRWDICWEASSPHGLIIRSAAFRYAPDRPSIPVLGDARVAEIFVPYHAGSPREFDLDPDPPLMTLGVQECPPPLTLVGSPATACREVRDRGLAWKNFTAGRRGEELTLWVIVQAVTYHYVIEWTFRDDGTIVGRVGSTGPKIGGGNDPSGHMHTYTWRLDVDLGGPDGNVARKGFHDEVGAEATDTGPQIGKEAGFPWNANRFTVLEVSGPPTLVNDVGRRSSYVLLPRRQGNARHSEAYSLKDFWVTRYRVDQLRGRFLPSYVNGDSVVGADIVIWYTASCHHEEGIRDEERTTTPVKWVEFELSPKNIWADTPFVR